MGQNRPRRRTAKGPEEESGEKREESRQAVTLFSAARRKEGQSGDVLNPRLALTRKGSDDRSAPTNGRKCPWGGTRGGNDRNGLPVFVRSGRRWRPYSARGSGTFFVPGTKPVDTPFPRGAERTRGALHLEIARPSAKHPQISESRARIHPPIPAFPLWGRRATVRTMHSARNGHELMGRKAGSPSPRFCDTSSRRFVSASVRRRTGRGYR
jgi:hypothetical protein